MNWSDIAGFGIAGNFTGHLEQAGEASDFQRLAVKDPVAPKGIFPFYLPNLDSKHYLSQNPYSHDTIQLLNDTENHQIEPEMSILFSVEYDNKGVTSIQPKYAMAHNDCSIRRKGAKKISEKKNWGALSKGVSAQKIAIDELSEEGVLEHYHLACFLRRDDEVHLYGITSPVKNYSYFHARLIEWIVNTLNHQQDDGPLENLWGWLEKAKRPHTICISIGATRYTEFGATTFLRAGDQSIVLLFDSRAHDIQELEQQLRDNTIDNLENISILSQKVLAPE